MPIQVHKVTRNYGLIALVVATVVFGLEFGIQKRQLDFAEDYRLWQVEQDKKEQQYQDKKERQYQEEQKQFEKNRVRNYLNWKRAHPEYGNIYDEAALPKE